MPQLYKVTIVRLVVAENKSHAKTLADQQQNPCDADAEIVTNAEQIPADWLNCSPYSADNDINETVSQMLGVFHGRTADDAHLEADYEDRVSGMED